MIKITPYYENTDNGEEILRLYLETVADVVPFLPEDVLDGFPVGNHGERAKYRQVGDGKDKKDSPYVKLLKYYKLAVDGTPEERRTADAVLAGKLIRKYSKKLYDHLYKKGLTKEEIAAGHVNRANLRELLTVRMKDGVLPDEFSDFCNYKATNKSKRELLNYVFRYEAFSANDNVYRILSLLGVEVCPYCNRQYITTYSPNLKDETGKHAAPLSAGIEDDPDSIDPGKAKTRAQLDHFKPKSIYPFLALSINNLVPSCAVCNHLKSDETDETIYPYSEGFDDRYVFSTDIPKQKLSYVLPGTAEAPKHFHIRLGIPSDKKDAMDPNDPFCKRAEASKRIFGLEGLYQAHTNYVAELYYQRYVFTPELIDELAERFLPLFARDLKWETGHGEDENPSAGKSKELEKQRIERVKNEIRNMLLLMDIDRKKMGDRPLAKLTRDITAEIEREYEKIPRNHREDRNK